MKIASTLLLQMAQPLGGDLEIPETILPIIKIGYPVLGTTFNVATDARKATASWGLNLQNVQAPAAAAIDLLCFTFDKGTYEVTLNVRMLTDFTNIPSAGPQYGPDLRDPGGVSSVPMCGFFALANVPQYQTWNATYTFSRSGWQLRLTSPATIAAQNACLSMAGYIRQLL